MRGRSAPTPHTTIGHHGHRIVSLWREVPLGERKPWNVSSKRPIPIAGWGWVFMGALRRGGRQALRTDAAGLSGFGTHDRSRRVGAAGHGRPSIPRRRRSRRENLPGGDGHAPMLVPLRRGGERADVVLRVESRHARIKRAGVAGKESVRQAKRIMDEGLGFRPKAGNDPRDNIGICHRRSRRRADPAEPSRATP